MTKKTHWSENLYNNMNNGNLPCYIEIEGTVKCNLKCEMCWYIKKKRPSNELMSLNDIKKIIDYSADKNIGCVLLTGGEVTLREDIYDIIEYCKNKKVNGILNTNGYKVAEKLIELLIQNDWMIVFSLDGHNAITHDEIRNVEGSFQSLIQTIRNAKRIQSKYNKGKLKIHTVIHDKNYTKLLNIANLIEELDIDSNDWGLNEKGFIDFSNVYSFFKNFSQNYFSGKYVKYYNELLSLEKILIGIMSKQIGVDEFKTGQYAKNILKTSKINCSIFNFPLINYEGDVYPCCYSNTVKNKKEYLLGSVFSNDLEEIFENKNIDKIGEKFNPIICDENNEYCTRCGRVFPQFYKSHIDIGNRHFNLDLSYKCNNNCEICLYGKECNDELYTDEFKKILKLNRTLGVKEITFLGRGVEFRKDIFELITYANRKGFSKINLKTNGRVFANEKYCKKINLYDISEIFIYLFSENKNIHDSFVKVKGAFDETMKGYNNLIKNGIKAKLVYEKW